MIHHSETPRVTSWYSLDGPDRDVVIVSQITVNRNLAGFAFSHLLPDEEELRLRRTINDALYAMEEEFALVDGETISPELRAFYEDRGVLVPGDRPGTAALRDSCDVMIRIGTGDHLRISGFSGGFDLFSARARATALDTQLESHLEYAVSLKMGYLAPDIQRVGTGLHGTTLLHLPAIEHSEGFQLPEDGADDRVLLKRYGGESDSNGSLYAATCLAEFGESEEETVTTLADFTKRLLHYEREARAELTRRHGDEIADTAGRALGTLRHARRLTAEETLDLLSVLRLGVSLGNVEEVDLSQVSDLLFVSRDSQVRVLTHENEAPIDVARAALVRRLLGST